MFKSNLKIVVLVFILHLINTGLIQAQNNNEKSRRSQRVVPMKEVQVS